MAKANAPEPELMIHTGGAYRLSNFKLRQLAYAELCFSNVLWPVFDYAELANVLMFFQDRYLRFGGKSPQAALNTAIRQ